MFSHNYAYRISTHHLMTEGTAKFSVKVTFKKQNTYCIFASQLKNMPVIIAISVPVSSPLNEKQLQLC